MAWGTVTIGGIALREELLAEQDQGSLKIGGQESHPPSTRAHVEATHHNVIGLGDLVVPVVFTDKTQLTGFYRVAAASSVLENVHNGAYMTATWQATLDRPVGDNVEVESRVPLIPRSDDLAGAQTPVFWHAPAVGATSYVTGSSTPTGFTDRASADGVVRVHTGIPSSPRWTISAANYLLGAARILLDGIRRAGVVTPPHEAWELHNGLVRVQGAADGAITVSCWDAGAWRSAKSYQVTVAGAPLTSAPELSIVRNDPEEAVVRLTFPGSPGRLTVDLAVRRGARVVTGTIKRHAGATLGVVRTAAEASTAATGGLCATAADADGNRFVMGSSRTITTATGTAAISRATSTVLDFFLGHEVDAAPQAGDAFADLLAQYLGAATGERTRLVRR